MKTYKISVNEIDLLLQTRIPAVVWIIFAISIAICLWTILRSSRPNHRKRHSIGGLLLIGYMAVVFSNTVVFRSDASSHKVVIIPLWSYIEAFEKHRSFFLIEDLLNVILFVPIGILAPVACDKNRWFYPVVLGFCFSLVIELAQLFSQRGWFEVDDLIHNTLGCLIGYFLFKGILKVKKTLITSKK